ncbi:MAG: acyltransferase [Bacteroidales bacterium]|nr:acyltransferase [Candidatus Sodaliphilus aphodohippi]
MESGNTNILPVKKVRESNMELLRIIAMILVMVVHANFRALPVPTAAGIALDPVSKFLMFFTEAVSVIAVNLFVLLSGWFGIRPRGRRLGELLFQVLFFGLFAIGVCAVLEPALLRDRVLSRLFMLGDGDYWFIKAYVGLYILAPVLNAFVEKATKQQFKVLLIAFFTFQCIYGWLFEATRWIVSGYSLTSFIGLYLLARYIRLYPCRLWQLNKWADAAIYAAYVVVLTVVMFIIKKNGGRGGVLYFYTCPLLIVGAVHFMLFFTKLPSFSSKVINWIAISAFSIYLTQSSSFIACFYDKAILGWFNTEPRGTFILYTAGLIIAVFVASILVDKVRIVLWNLFMYPIDKIFKKNKI